MTGIRNTNLHDVGFDVATGGNLNFTLARIFQSFRSIVDEIDQHTAQQGAIRAYRRKIFGERGSHRDAVEASGENFQGFVDQSAGVRGNEFGARKTHELRELLYQVGE